MADIHIYRIDHHGSLVRPGGLEDDVDAAIDDVLFMQRKLRVTQLTDGHFRRRDFRAPILEGLGGFERTGGRDDDGFESWASTGEVGPGGSILAAEADFLDPQYAEWARKVSLPSPAYLASRTWQEGGPYASPVDLGHAIAASLRDEVAALLAAGVKYVQLDNPNYADHYAGDASRIGGIGVLDAIAIDGAVLEGIERPEGAKVGICVDWGQHPVDEADEQVAWAVFGELPYDRFLIPFFAQPFVDQQLLQFVPEGTAVALGIVDATTPELEDIDEIMSRIDAAFELKSDEEVAVAPSRGFQDAAYLPAPLTIEEQKRKITHVETIARMTWGNEL